MKWIALTNENQLNEIVEKSKFNNQVIFKHSTTCSISAAAFNRLKKDDGNTKHEIYYLDLLTYRPLSNAVESMFGIKHESPQVLVIKNGACIFNESHLGIQLDEVLEFFN